MVRSIRSLLLLVVGLLLLATVSRADDMRLVMPDGASRDFYGATLLQGMRAADGKLWLQISPAAGQAASGVEADRVMEMRLGTGGAGRPFDVEYLDASGSSVRAQGTLLLLSDGRITLLPPNSNSVTTLALDRVQRLSQVLPPTPTPRPTPVTQNFGAVETTMAADPFSAPRQAPANDTAAWQSDETDGDWGDEEEMDGADGEISWGGESIEIADDVSAPELGLAVGILVGGAIWFIFWLVTSILLAIHAFQNEGIAAAVFIFCCNIYYVYYGVAKYDGPGAPFVKLATVIVFLGSFGIRFLARNLE